MNKKGKGTYNLRQITKILNSNGYTLSHRTKHYIFKNNNNDTISIPHHCKDSVLIREFKKHNIIF